MARRLLDVGPEPEAHADPERRRDQRRRAVEQEELPVRQARVADDEEGRGAQAGEEAGEHHEDVPAQPKLLLDPLELGGGDDPPERPEVGDAVAEAAPRHVDDRVADEDPGEPDDDHRQEPRVPEHRAERVERPSARQPREHATGRQDDVLRQREAEAAEQEHGEYGDVAGVEPVARQHLYEAL